MKIVLQSIAIYVLQFRNIVLLLRMLAAEVEAMVVIAFLNIQFIRRIVRT